MRGCLPTSPVTATFTYSYATKSVSEYGRFGVTLDEKACFAQSCIFYGSIRSIVV